MPSVFVPMSYRVIPKGKKIKLDCCGICSEKEPKDSKKDCYCVSSLIQFENFEVSELDLELGICDYCGINLKSGQCR
jgi:hypothetical protein